MIEDLLNRTFVLNQIDQLVDRFDQVDSLELEMDMRRRSSEPLPVDDVTNEDYEEAHAALIEASQREPEEHLLLHTPAADRRDGSMASLEEVAFLSRDAMTSIVQSALEEYFEEQEPDMVEEPADERRRTETGPSVSDRRLLGRFEITDPIYLSDPLWVNSLIAKGWRRFRNKRKFSEKPATPLKMADNARVILVGDWGTGLPRAQDVAAEMRNVIEEGKAEGREQHVVHLGDVYYSGWEREYEKRFLPHWPVELGEESENIAVMSWACNGNHDMYSGGYGYFDRLLADQRFTRQEQSSYFSIENEHWQILGLDTAWDDNALKDPQAQWIRDRLRDHPNHKTMLLSHHQLFSAYEYDGSKLREKLQDVLDARRIDAWFWGHEHRCVLYKPHMGVRFGRCVGHGGVPVYPNRGQLPEPAFYQYREYFHTGFDDWALCGFAVLDFQGRMLQVRYVDQFGHPHKEETIDR
jgi:predicted phosphodiesterase